MRDMHITSTLIDVHRKMRERAQSAKYGRVLAQSPSACVPDHHATDRPAAVKKVEEVKPVVVAKTALADKVSSSGYGKVAPPQGEKKAPPRAEPLWSPSKKAPAVLALPEAVKPKGYDHVQHSGYGRTSPTKAERVEKEFAPKWTPNSPKVQLGQPEAVKSRLYEHVASSGYGSTYSPASSYRPHEQRWAAWVGWM